MNMEKLIVDVVTVQSFNLDIARNHGQVKAFASFSNKPIKKFS